MQPPQDKNFALPPPVYSMPPRSFSFPLWGRILLGCGILLILLFVLLGFGVSRLFLGGRGALQTQFCAQNLRTTQRGLELYSQAYDQPLPPSAAWMDAAVPYVKQRTDFKCPVVRVAHPEGFGYAFNGQLAGSKTAQIDAPGTAAEVYDSTDLQRNASDDFTSLPAPPRHLFPRTKTAPNPPKSGNLILYADGHIRILGLDGTSDDISKMNMRRALFSPRQKTK